MSDTHKQQVAQAVLQYLPEGEVIGVGTGSTVNFFIDALATIKGQIEGTVSSSEASTARLKQHGIPVYELNHVGDIPVYVDGADEVDPALNLIKGGGGALTREKIIASAANEFICIVDPSKQVKVLGAFPLPVEVIPMARSAVARAIVALGGQPVWREDVVTDNGNQILDVHNLSIVDPAKLERQLNDLPGVVTCGIFAKHGADILLVGGPDGVQRHKR